MVLDRLAGKSPAFRAGAVIACLLLVAGLTALTWYGWLGHDHEYQVDAAGVAHGPYETWQVVGCALTLLALALVTALLSRPNLVFAIPVALTLAWSIDAASQDETGLWIVGAFMVLVGSTAVAAVLVGLWTRLGKALRQHQR